MKDKKPHIPGIPYWLLKQMYAFDIEEGYAGDIEEEFNEILLCLIFIFTVGWGIMLSE